MWSNSVVDPYSFFPDPDPAPEFDVGDQYGSGSKSGYASRSKFNTDPGLKWPKIEKKLQLKFFFLFWSKTAIYLSLGLHKVCPSYRRSLQLSKEAIQWSNTSKHELLPIFFYFCGSFLPSWVRIRIPNTNPDPQTRLNTDPIRIRFRIRIHNPDQRIINSCTMRIKSTHWDYCHLAKKYLKINYSLWQKSVAGKQQFRGIGIYE